MLAVAVIVSLVYSAAGDRDTLSTEGAVFEMVIESEFALEVEPSSTVTVQVRVSPLLVAVDKVLEEPTVVPLRSQL